MDVVELVNKYGFPIVMAVGMGYIIKYVWTWATLEVKPVISDANTVLIALIDRIRMLDNDLIRLNQKVNTVLHLRGKSIEHERVEAEKEINQAIVNQAENKVAQEIGKDLLVERFKQLQAENEELKLMNNSDDKEAKGGSS
jgi:guanylate kinase